MKQKKSIHNITIDECSNININKDYLLNQYYSHVNKQFFVSFVLIVWIVLIENINKSWLIKTDML